MKKIFYKMVCLICIMIMIIVLMIHGFRSFSKTQVKSFDLVTNKEIPISKISGFYVDSDENFYVGIDDFSWIEIFDKNGKFVCSIAMKGLVYNFYVDKDGLLHIFCTYRTSDNIYEQIIDIEKNSIISEEVIKDVCKEKNTKYIEADFKHLEVKKSDINSQIFDCTILDEKFENMEIKLIGEHQVNNAVLALTVIKVLRDERHIEISDEAIKRAFLNTRWPGRIEKIKDCPTFIIDGAHNEDGARSLSKALEKNFKGKKMTLLIGMLKDKDIDSVLEILMDKFDKVITTTPDSDRAISCDELKEKIEKYVSDVTAIPKIEDAVKYTLENAQDDDIIISAGSLYMIGHVRQLVK